MIAQGQLAMVDFRMVYQDFNGFVLWGTIPQEMEDIDRIEIIRGPGSAVWGANAMHGIVHIVTKSPRDMVGTRVKVTGGQRSTAGVTFSHTGAGRKAAYRVSGGYDRQGPYDQPTGVIPGSEGPLNPGGTLYPEYENLDKRRYRVNGRIDYNIDNETTVSVAGGYAGLEGIFLSPGGPATMESGTYQAFGKVDLTRRAMRITAFMNNDAYDGLFIIGSIPATMNDQTYNIDFSNTRVVGGEHYLTYGGNARHNAYDNNLLRNAKDRTSLGAFLQDDFFVTNKMRLVVGARWDYIEPMGNAVSPRASLTIEPWSHQRFRVTYNRAFQAPSVLQNYLDLPSVLEITFPDFNNPGSGELVTVPIVAASRGNTELEPKKLDAFEIGWSGHVGKHVTVDVVAYWNEFNDAFQKVVSETYTGSNLPPFWPFDPTLLDGPLANSIPSMFTIENLGKSTEKGVEVGAEARIDRRWTIFGSYSWQDIPEVADYTPVLMPDGSEVLPVNIPPRHRISGGLAVDLQRLFATGTVYYQDEAFWTDVIDSRGWGPTQAFTTVNLTAGVRLASDRMVISATVMNLFDAEVQQHLWGDFIRRRVIGQVS